MCFEAFFDGLSDDEVVHDCIAGPDYVAVDIAEVLFESWNPSH
jgi:hypothetical protein